MRTVAVSRLALRNDDDDDHNNKEFITISSALTSATNNNNENYETNSRRHTLPHINTTIVNKKKRTHNRVYSTRSHHASGEDSQNCVASESSRTRPMATHLRFMTPCTLFTCGTISSDTMWLNVLRNAHAASAVCECVCVGGGGGRRSDGGGRQRATPAREYTRTALTQHPGTPAEPTPRRCRGEPQEESPCAQSACTARAWTSRRAARRACAAAARCAPASPR
jgi:hypothetical protein